MITFLLRRKKKKKKIVTCESMDASEEQKVR
jgi:hypothetical protein